MNFKLIENVKKHFSLNMSFNLKEKTSFRGLQTINYRPNCMDTFVFHSLKSIISNLATREISIF